MTKKKSVRQRGKTQLREYFKKLSIDDRVAVVDQKSIPYSFPKRIIGMTGKVTGIRGTYKVIELKDGNMLKQYIIHPINLKLMK